MRRLPAKIRDRRAKSRPPLWGQIVDYKIPHINSIVGKNNIIKEFKISQNYPNPFNPSTTISYTLPKNAYVNIYVINVLGEKITTVKNIHQKSGKQVVTWNGKNSNNQNVVSGLYFIYFDIQTDDNYYKSVNKCILLR